MPAQTLSIKLAYFCLLAACGLLWYVPTDPAPTDILLLIASVFTFASMQFAQPKLKLVYVLIYIFLLANILSMFAIRVPAQAYRSLAIIVFLLGSLFIYPSIATHLGEKYINRIYDMIIASTLIAAVIGLLAYFRLMPGPTMWYFRSEEGIRLSPFFQDPNVYSPFVCFGAVLLLTYLWDRTKSLWLMVVFPLAVLVIILSFSRAGWLNLVVSLATLLVLTLFFQRHVLAKQRLLVWMLAGAIVGTIALPYFIEAAGIGDILQRRLQIQDYDTHRFENQFAALQVSLERPFGVGPGHYVGRTHFPESEFPLDTHSIYLKVLVERGWLGFVSFFSLITYCFVMGLRSMRLNPDRAHFNIALLSALTGLLANGFFISALHWRHLFIIMGLIFAEYILTGKQQSQLELRVA